MEAAKRFWNRNGNNRALIIAGGCVGMIVICLCVAAAGVLSFYIFPRTETRVFSREMPGTRIEKPPYYGVFIKQTSGYMELDEQEVFDSPVIGQYKNLQVVSDARPVIAIWRDTLDLDNLVLYKLGKTKRAREQVRFTAKPASDGVVEVTPASALSSGEYCMVQGDPMAAFLSGWCFIIR